MNLDILIPLLVDGLHLQLSLLCVSRLSAYWGVVNDAFYNILEMPWSMLDGYIHSEEFLAGNCLRATLDINL